MVDFPLHTPMERDKETNHMKSELLLGHPISLGSIKKRITSEADSSSEGMNGIRTDINMGIDTH